MHFPTNCRVEKKLSIFRSKSSKATIRVAVTFVTRELHICNCKDCGQIIHSPRNTSFPIFHHERPIYNLPVHPYVTRRTNESPIGNSFADISHQGPCMQGRLVQFEGKGTHPTQVTPAMLRPKQASIIHIFHTDSLRLTYRHLMMKAKKLSKSVIFN